ncbi:hypothetical protein Mgra_00009681 [Meloidogyne graminicola]|nr:hypothetical protein Mgra_00009681 [Meloidogyne graminicola]
MRQTILFDLFHHVLLMIQQTDLLLFNETLFNNLSIAGQTLEILIGITRSYIDNLHIDYQNVDNANDVDIN